MKRLILQPLVCFGVVVFFSKRWQSALIQIFPEKKILPPLLSGFELATFRSRARRSNQQAIPASAKTLRTALFFFVVVVVVLVYLTDTLEFQQEES